MEEEAEEAGEAGEEVGISIFKRRVSKCGYGVVGEWWVEGERVRRIGARQKKTEIFAFFLFLLFSHDHSYAKHRKKGGMRDWNEEKWRQMYISPGGCAGCGGANLEISGHRIV